jgi:hypothetical protein
MGKNWVGGEDGGPMVGEDFAGFKGGGCWSCGVGRPLSRFWGRRMEVRTGMRLIHCRGELSTLEIFVVLCLSLLSLVLLVLLVLLDAKGSHIERKVTSAGAIHKSFRW